MSTMRQRSHTIILKYSEYISNATDTSIISKLWEQLDAFTSHANIASYNEYLYHELRLRQVEYKYGLSSASTISADIRNTVAALMEALCDYIDNTPDDKEYTLTLKLFTWMSEWFNMDNGISTLVPIDTTTVADVLSLINAVRAKTRP